MSIAKIEVSSLQAPWATVAEICKSVPCESWLLVGGLMTQTHAMLSGLESRATSDIDMLVDVLADSANINRVANGLRTLGYEFQEPGLRGAAFHRLKKGKMVVDILVADHLPKNRPTKMDRWPMMEIPGGAQAVERKMPLIASIDGAEYNVYIPNLLGAIVLKAAAYSADSRDKQRHLDDVAMLVSLIADPAADLACLHGSDKKRLRKVNNALADINDSAWRKLMPERRQHAQDVLAILAS